MFVCGGTARASMGKGHRPLRSHLWQGWGRPIPDSILPGLRGRQGWRFSSEKSGSAWDGEGNVGFPEKSWRLGRWGQGTQGTTAINPCGQ